MLKRPPLVRPPLGAHKLVDNIANIAGLSSAKFGADDKQQGYIVKQNSILKLILLILLVMGLAGSVLLSTVYELKIAKRGLVASETYHLKREQHDHKHLMNLALDLQQSLGHNLQSSTLVEEFRAVLAKLVSNKNEKVAQLFAAASNGKNSLAELEHIQNDFQRNVDNYLTHILQTLQRNNAEAKEKIRKLSELIVFEINSESNQAKRYAEKMQALDVDDEYLESLHVDEADLEEEDEDNTERELEQHLENFFAKLNKLPTIHLEPERIAELDAAWADFDKVLGDETRDADVDLFAQKMQRLSGHALPPGMDTSVLGQRSVLEFYSHLIENAKLAPFKQNLVNLYNGWKTPGSKLTIREVLAEVENVAQQSNLRKMFDFMDEED